MNRLRIISLNVRGLRTPSKLGKIVSELTFLNCDVIFLQETHVSCKTQADKVERLWNGKCFWSFGTSNSASVAVFFSPRFPGEIVRYLFDSNGRILSLLIDFQNYRFNLVNVYAPTAVSERKSFFSCLYDFFISQGTLIIGGDFNCFDNTLDKFNCSIVPSIDKSSLRSLKSDFSLTDIWRKQNPQKILFTWSNSDHSQMSRIDRFLIANSLLPNVLSSDILPCVLSDHDFITLEFSVNGLFKHGLGVWKFNV